MTQGRIVLQCWLSVHTWEIHTCITTWTKGITNHTWNFVHTHKTVCVLHVHTVYTSAGARQSEREEVMQLMSSRRCVQKPIGKLRLIEANQISYWPFFLQDPDSHSWPIICLYALTGHLWSHRLTRSEASPTHRLPHRLGVGMNIFLILYGLRFEMGSVLWEKFNLSPP